MPSSFQVAFIREEPIQTLPLGEQSGVKSFYPGGPEGWYTTSGSWKTATGIIQHIARVIENR
jgi:hypothetical protein